MEEDRRELIVSTRGYVKEVDLWLERVCQARFTRALLIFYSTWCTTGVRFILLFTGTWVESGSNQG